MGRVLLTDYAWPNDRVERSVIESAQHELVTGPKTAGDAAEIEELARRYRPDAIMTCWAPVTAATIAAAPALRIVARMGVGLDNIALDAASRAGAWVTNVPDYCVEEVSDHAVGLILASIRGIAYFDARVKEGTWEPTGARLLRLATLKVGIAGLGRIGRATARKLRGMGSSVIAYDSHASGDGVTTMVALDVLLAESDIIVLHLPLTPQTHHFIDRESLAAMKRGAFLVNVSRGPLVDNAALLSALESHGLSGAALDVIEGEPTPPRELISRRDVIVTPHVGFSSETSVVELRTRAAEEVVRVLSGKAPVHPCNDPAISSLSVAP